METPRSVHHVGLAVEDLDGALDTYERLFGARLEQRSRVDDQGVEAASIRVGESRLELLAQPKAALVWVGGGVRPSDP